MLNKITEFLKDKMSLLKLGNEVTDIEPEEKEFTEDEKLQKRIDEIEDRLDKRGMLYCKINGEVVFVNTKRLFGDNFDKNDPENQTLIDMTVESLEKMALKYERDELKSCEEVAATL